MGCCDGGSLIFGWVDVVVGWLILNFRFLLDNRQLKVKTNIMKIYILDIYLISRCSSAAQGCGHDSGYGG